MNAPAPTDGQIKALVQTALDKAKGARVVAVHSPARGAWSSEIRRPDGRFRVRWCPATLEIREQMAALNGPGDGLVIVTPLRDEAMGSDLLARFARQRVHQVAPWSMLAEAFRAQRTDPRLRSSGPLAELLLGHIPVEGFPPVSGGFLDLDTFWGAFFRRILDLDASRPDLAAVLRWCAVGSGAGRLASFPAAVKERIASRLEASAGPAARLVLAAVEAGYGADAVAIGLVCDLLFPGTGLPETERGMAAVRLERFTGGHAIDPGSGRAWAIAAAHLIRTAGPDQADWVRRLLHRADGLLEEVRIAAFAPASDLLPSGFEARLLSFAEALRRSLEDPSVLGDLEGTAEAVAAHHQARSQPARLERVRMAVRLARWLAVPGPGADPKSFAEAAAGYAREGCFVDRARTVLLVGDESAAVASALAELCRAARSRRETQNAAFARLLVDWHTGGAKADGVIPVEEIGTRLLAPLAKLRPVLLLVVDGMSLPVFRSLLEDLVAQGWNELVPEEGPVPVAGVALMPSVTEVSRATLFAGRPQSAASGMEKTLFAEHPALAAATPRGKGRPVLFHKGDLADPEGSGLAHEVRKAILAQDQKVVGVVLNAVDDDLSGSSQMVRAWSLAMLPILGQMLREARLAERLLVLTADHGHLLDERTEALVQGDGDRWRRPDTGDAREGEILMTGERVRTPGGGRSAVLAWSEAIRYGMKKTGYHGGASPQEILVPLSVLTCGDRAVPGWRHGAPVEPSWWRTPGLPEPPSAQTTQRSEPPPRPRPALPLFERVADPEPQRVSPGGATAAAPSWIDQLLASPVWQMQVKLAGRSAPSEADVRATLAALDERGGRLTYVALAQKLGYPKFRVRGLLANLRRVLNLDGAEVLVLDEGNELVEVNNPMIQHILRVL